MSKPWTQQNIVDAAGAVEVCLHKYVNQDGPSAYAVFCAQDYERPAEYVAAVTKLLTARGFRVRRSWVNWDRGYYLVWLGTAPMSVWCTVFSGMLAGAAFTLLYRAVLTLFFGGGA